MKITGQYTIDAPREQVWEALNDLDVLARVVPGCQRLEQVGEHEFEGTLKIGIQAIKGTYHGRIRLEDIQPPAHYRLVANGKGSNGVVDGVGSVTLEEAEGKTVLNYGGEAKIGGTLASVGQRLIEGTAKQLINQSLKALTEQIARRAAPTEATPAPDAATPAAEAVPATAAPAEPVAPPVAEHAHNGATPAAQPAHPSVPATPAAVEAAPLAGPHTHEPRQAPAQPPAPPQAPLPTAGAPARRAVVVPEHEQLKPESVISGVVKDMLNERPWLVPALIGFLLGLLIGRSQRKIIVVRGEVVSHDRKRR